MDEIHLSEEVHQKLINSQYLNAFIGYKVVEILMTTDKEGGIEQIQIVLSQGKKKQWLYIFPSIRDNIRGQERRLALKIE